MDEALLCLRRAVADVPDHAPANLRLLKHGHADDRAQAAAHLLSPARGTSLLKACIAELAAAGHICVAAVRGYAEAIEGFVWSADGAPINVRFQTGDEAWNEPIKLDPAHPLSSDSGIAATIAQVRVRPGMTTNVLIERAGKIVHRDTLAPCVPEARHRPRPVAGAPARQPYAAAVTVIVPVYGDLPATRACIDSLLAQIDGEPNQRILIVNDASPLPGIKPLLARAARHPRIRVVENAVNLGFVAAVNRGLALVPDGDVILLNADTVVPQGFAARLARAASFERVGTVTPLSNNGEFTSFPVTAACNDMLDASTLAKLDRIAASVNADHVIDMPNGIGFCLYITRECLDATGPLSEDYVRGYYEDVDFCLRAAESGFRNVCAANVFVAHAGSKSFAGEKRGLVLRNLTRLDERFPDHRRDVTAYLALDPLASPRAAIERRLQPAGRQAARGLVGGAGAARDVIADRAAELQQSGERVLILTHGPARTNVRLRAADGTSPQSLAFDIADHRQRQDFIKVLKDQNVQTCEFCTFVQAPHILIQCIQECGLHIDVLVDEIPITGGPDAAPCPVWLDATATARHLICATDLAHAFLEQRPEIDIGALVRPTRQRPPCVAPRPGTIAVLLANPTPVDMRGVADMIGALTRALPNRPLIAFGSMPHPWPHGDLELSIVPGPFPAADWDRLMRGYGIERIVQARAQPVFGSGGTTPAWYGSLPLAYWDWSAGTLPCRRGDCALDPAALMQDVEARLREWGIRDR
jgi:GT2 family glycosyltransferase